MARYFITGSSDGLGSLAARALAKKGHKVVLHARNAQRAKDAKSACPDAEDVVIGDLSSFADTKELAAKVNKLGKFDCIIHNAGVFQGGGTITADGIPALAAVNSFAPYILTSLIEKPDRLVIVSSGLHNSGAPNLKDITWKERPRSYSDFQAYCNSKVHNILLANAVADRWPNVTSSSLDPDWVPTKLGGYSAPGDINVAVKTYVDLAEGNLPNASGKYYKESQERKPKKETLNKALQDKYMQICEEVTGVPFPK